MRKREGNKKREAMAKKRNAPDRVRR